MIKFSQEKLLLLHQFLVQETGGEEECEILDCSNRRSNRLTLRLTAKNCFLRKRKRQLGWNRLSC